MSLNKEVRVARRLAVAIQAAPVEYSAEQGCGIEAFETRERVLRRVPRPEVIKENG